MPCARPGKSSTERPARSGSRAGVPSAVALHLGRRWEGGNAKGKSQGDALLGALLSVLVVPPATERVSSRFPTRRGQLRRDGTFQGTGSGPRFGLVSSTSRGEEFEGTFQFTPTRGDCVTFPITEGRVTVQGLWQ